MDILQLPQVLDILSRKDRGKVRIRYHATSSASTYRIHPDLSQDITIYLDRVTTDMMVALLNTNLIRSFHLHPTPTWGISSYINHTHALSMIRDVLHRQYLPDSPSFRRSYQKDMRLYLANILAFLTRISDSNPSLNVRDLITIAQHLAPQGTVQNILCTTSPDSWTEIVRTLIQSPLDHIMILGWLVYFALPDEHASRLDLSLTAQEYRYTNRSDLHHLACDLLRDELPRSSLPIPSYQRVLLLSNPVSMHQGQLATHCLYRYGVFSHADQEDLSMLWYDRDRAENILTTLLQGKRITQPYPPEFSLYHYTAILSMSARLRAILPSRFFHTCITQETHEEDDAILPIPPFQDMLSLSFDQAYPLYEEYRTIHNDQRKRATAYPEPFRSFARPAGVLCRSIASFSLAQAFSLADYASTSEDWELRILAQSILQSIRDSQDIFHRVHSSLFHTS